MMNKEELVRTIYQSVNGELKQEVFTMQSSGEVYDALMEAISSALESCEDVRLPGFGKMYVTHSAARTIPHPRNPGQVLEIGATRQIRFKAYDSFKNRVNGR